jgi:hypothetical protein
MIRYTNTYSNRAENFRGLNTPRAHPRTQEAHLSPRRGTLERGRCLPRRLVPSAPMMFFLVSLPRAKSLLRACASGFLPFLLPRRPDVVVVPEAFLTSPAGRATAGSALAAVPCPGPARW